MRRFITVPRLYAAAFLIILCGLGFATNWTDPPPGFGMKARPHNNLGAAYQKVGRLADAKKQYLIALSKDRYYIHALVNLGTVLETEGNFKDAEYYYRAALSIDPEIGIAHYNLGNTLTKLGQFDDAIEEFKNVVKCGSLIPEAYNNAGYVLYQQGKKQEAMQLFYAALKADPGNIPARKNIEILSRL
jgi:Tfp pilus assembly protein PilF